MQEKNSSLSEKQFYLFRRVSLVDKFNFYEYLSIMLDWWVTIVSSLEWVQWKIKNVYFKEKLQELLVYISSWDSLSKAMKKIPDIFWASETSIIEAWEKSWTLVDSLASIALEFKKLHELKSTIKNALTYPLIILIFLVVAVMIVMTYVIPSIIPLIEDAWVEKPFATVALIATSNFVSNNWILIIIFIIAVIFWLIWYKNTASWKRNIDVLLLKMPLVWVLYKNYIIASTSSVLGSLLNSWVPIVKTLILVWKTTDNVVYEDLFNQISIKVWTWKKLVDSILEVDETSEYFPADFLQLLSVWEKTASISKVTKKLNEQYTREVNYSLANLTKWIEPIAIFIAWIFVLWFAYAIFWAILKLTDTVG